jgi:hypothetical protein
MEVKNRQKDEQYSRRAHSDILRQKQLHRLRHIIAELSARLPAEERAKPEVQEMAGYGCLSVRPETFFTFSRRYCGRLVRCTRFSMSPHRLRGRACQPTHINAMKKQTKFPDGH